MLQRDALPLLTLPAVALLAASPFLLLQGAAGDEDGQIKLLSPCFASPRSFPPEQPAAPWEGLKLPMYIFFFLHVLN